MVLQAQHLWIIFRFCKEPQEKPYPMNHENVPLNVEALLHLPLPISQRLSDYLLKRNSIICNLIVDVNDEPEPEKKDRDGHGKFELF